jgi:hypothetical protein
MDKNMFLRDHADPEPNTDTLDEIFNVSVNNTMLVDSETGEILGEVNSMRKELDELRKDLPDADQIIVGNIDRANRILDRVENSIGTGAFTAAMVEAAAKLIESITSAANSITGISFNAEVVRQKDRDLDRKEKELAIKGLVKGAENVTINNNQLIMNREDLLKMIKGDTEEE